MRTYIISTIVVQSVGIITFPSIRGKDVGQHGAHFKREFGKISKSATLLESGFFSSKH